jgi:hypothetical protein
MAIPPGAHRSDQTPTAAHGAVVVVCLVIAAVLIAAAPAIGGGGLLTLLVLLLAVFALVLPVAIVVTLWRRAGAGVRALIGVAVGACGLLLVLAVIRIAAVAPALLAA